MPSLNILLTTIGRETLTRMLTSLKDQLLPEDYLTIVSDAGHNMVRQCLIWPDFQFKCTVTHIANSNQLGYWGHASRNKYQNKLPGDFIMNADDDDRYVEGAIAKVRETAIEPKLYIFKHEDNGNFAWSKPGVVEIGNIGTSCGVIPNTGNLPDWEYFYGGDGRFYEKLSQMIPYEFIDFCIYKVKDTP